MKLASVIASLRAMVVTFALGLAFGLLGVLALHYFATARALVAENGRIKEQMQGVVERLVELEGAMARVAAARRAVDRSSLAGFTSILEQAGLERHRDGQVVQALAPVLARPGDTAGYKPRYASPFTNLLERFSTARNSAGVLEAELAETADAVDQRREILRALPAIMPAKGAISSEFGLRPSPFHQGSVGMHNGLDVAAAEGAHVVATADGVVTYASNHGSFGKLVQIEHGYGVATKYGHNAALLVKKGEHVVRGQVIATVGNTGRSTGAHVHYEVSIYDKAVDPRRFLFDARPDETAPLVMADLANLGTGGEAPATTDLGTEPATTARIGIEWDAPVFAMHGGLAFATAPRRLQAATTGDLAAAVLALLMIAIASAVMRWPTLARADGEPGVERVPTAAELIREFHRKNRGPSRWQARLKSLARR